MKNIYYLLSSCFFLCFISFSAAAKNCKTGAKECTKTVKSTCVAKADSNPLENNGKEVSGKIKNACQMPLNNVTITFFSYDHQEIVLHTDKEGNFAIGDLKPGTYRIEFTKDGYQKITRQKVVIREDEGFIVKLQMKENDPLHIFPSPLHFADF